MPYFARFPNRPNRPILAACLVAVAVLALPLAGKAQSAPVKIGVVNLDYIVANSSEGKQLQARLQQFQQTIQAEAAQKNEAARAIRQQIAEGANSLSEDRLSELQKQYEDAQIAIKRYQDDKQREGRKIQEEGLRAIEKQLEPVFRAVRDEEGFDIILNNVPGTVVMVSERVDVTQKVIDRLDAAAAN